MALGSTAVVGSDLKTERMAVLALVMMCIVRIIASIMDISVTKTLEGLNSLGGSFRELVEFKERV
jgi:hypothetical protein